VFVKIVIESKIYHIYKPVLLTIKVAARNISRAHRNTRNAINHSTSKLIHTIIEEPEKATRGG
jgi:hypothetical protein